MRARFRYRSHRLDQAALRRLLSAAPGTPLGDDLDARARRVATGARQQVGVDTGLLRSTIRVEAGPGYRDIVAGRRGSGTKYVLPHHDGAGPHVIRARNARALRFRWHGRIVFFAKVNHPGNRPNRFLVDSLPLAR